VLTLYKSGALRNIINVAEEYGIQVLAVQEVRWIGSGVLDNREYTFYYSGHSKTHQFGTGFVVSRKIRHLVIDYAEKLASRRNEWYSFTRGLYLAFDLIGVRYTEDAGQFYPIRTCLSTSNPTLPQPADYNFIFRILNLYPPETAGYREEAMRWLALRSVDRTRLVALYTAVLASASNTSLYGINFTTQQIIEWSVGLQLAPLTAELLTSPLNTPDVALGQREVVILVKIIPTHALLLKH
jgi:hypothetical protein